MERDQHPYVESLQQLPYRSLQQKAKSLQLPSNVKKTYLIQMIIAKQYQSEAEVQRIVQLVKLERQQLASNRKKKGRKKPRVQGSEISSTNNFSHLSSMVDLTPKRTVVVQQGPIMPSLRETLMQDWPSPQNDEVALRPRQIFSNNQASKNSSSQGSGNRQQFLVKYQPHQSLSKDQAQTQTCDRVLRSYSMKDYKKPNYCLMNDSLLQVLKSDTQTESKKVSITTRDGKYPKLNVTARCVVARTQAHEGRSYLKRENQLVASSSQPPVKRQRTSSGNPSMTAEKPEPNTSEYFQSVSIRRTDGQYSKIQVLVQKPQKRIEKVSSSKEKLESSNKRSSLKLNAIKTYNSKSVPQTYKSILDSNDIRVENTFANQDCKLSKPHTKQELPKNYRSVEVTVQDIINCNIDARTQSFSNPNISEYVLTDSSTNTEDEYVQTVTHPDYPNMRAHVEENIQETLKETVDFSRMSTTVTFEESGVKASQTENADSFSDYCHKKIRAEQVRSNRMSVSIQREDPETARSQRLPKINSAFPNLKNCSAEVMQPLYVQVSEEHERLPYYPISSTSMLESLYNFKGSFLMHVPFESLLRTTALTTCVYSTPTMSSAVLQPLVVPANECCVASYEQPRLQDDQSQYGKVATHYASPAKPRHVNDHKYPHCVSVEVNKPHVGVNRPQYVEINRPQTVEMNKPKYVSAQSQYVEAGKPLYVNAATDAANNRWIMGAADSGRFAASNGRLDAATNGRFLDAANSGWFVKAGENGRSIDAADSGRFVYAADNSRFADAADYLIDAADGRLINAASNGRVNAADKRRFTTDNGRFVDVADTGRLMTAADGNGRSVDAADNGRFLYAAENGRLVDAASNGRFTNAAKPENTTYQIRPPHVETSPVHPQYCASNKPEYSGDISRPYNLLSLPACDTANNKEGSNSSLVVEASHSMDVSGDATIPEMVEDALELISQDGDYMERIGMDVRMQCILCSWAGPKILLEYHIRKEHSEQIIKSDRSEWNITYRLGSLMNQELWLSKVIEYKATLYALSVKYEDPDHFMASVSTLSPDAPSHPGSVTVYNRVTGEPYNWRGEITLIDSNMPYENDTKCLQLALSNLNLIPNRENIKLLNRELVIESPCKVIVGSPELNDIHVILFVKVFC